MPLLGVSQGWPWGLVSVRFAILVVDGVVYEDDERVCKYILGVCFHPARAHLSRDTSDRHAGASTRNSQYYSSPADCREAVVRLEGPRHTISAART